MCGPWRPKACASTITACSASLKLSWAPCSGPSKGRRQKRSSRPCRQPSPQRFAPRNSSNATPRRRSSDLKTVARFGTAGTRAAGLASDRIIAAGFVSDVVTARARIQCAARPPRRHPVALVRAVSGCPGRPANVEQSSQVRRNAEFWFRAGLLHLQQHPAAEAHHRETGQSTTMSRSQDWIRISQAARVTGIPARTIRWWATRGRIPFAQIGGPRTWLLVYLPALTSPGVNPGDTRGQPQR